MDLKTYSRCRRVLANFGLEHGVGQSFREAAALRQAEPARGRGHGDDGHGVPLP